MPSVLFLSNGALRDRHAAKLIQQHVRRRLQRRLMLLSMQSGEHLPPSRLRRVTRQFSVAKIGASDQFRNANIIRPLAGSTSVSHGLRHGHLKPQGCKSKSSQRSTSNSPSSSAQHLNGSNYPRSGSSIGSSSLAARLLNPEAGANAHVSMNVAAARRHQPSVRRQSRRASANKSSFGPLPAGFSKESAVDSIAKKFADPGGIGFRSAYFFDWQDQKQRFHRGAACPPSRPVSAPRLRRSCSAAPPRAQNMHGYHIPESASLQSSLCPLEQQCADAALVSAAGHQVRRRPQTAGPAGTRAPRIGRPCADDRRARSSCESLSSTSWSSGLLVKPHAAERGRADVARPALCRRTSAPPGAAASNTTAIAVPEGSVWVVRFQPARQEWVGKWALASRSASASLRADAALQPPRASEPPLQQLYDDRKEREVDLDNYEFMSFPSTTPSEAAMEDVLANLRSVAP